jgi:hypothetical protein
MKPLMISHTLQVYPSVANLMDIPKSPWKSNQFQ